MSRQPDSPTTIRLSPELIAAIDGARGDVSRQRGVVRAIERELAGTPKPVDRSLMSPKVMSPKFKAPKYE